MGVKFGRFSIEDSFSFSISFSYSISISFSFSFLLAPSPCLRFASGLLAACFRGHDAGRPEAVPYIMIPIVIVGAATSRPQTRHHPGPMSLRGPFAPRGNPFSFFLAAGSTDCHSQCAHWLRNDTGRGSVAVFHPYAQKRKAFRPSFSVHDLFPSSVRRSQCVHALFIRHMTENQITAPLNFSSDKAARRCCTKVLRAAANAV